MELLRQVNYQSDFDVLLHLTDSDGNTVGFPDFDFVASFKTVGNGEYKVGQIDGTKCNVADASGDVRVVFDNHKLSPGKLSLEFRADEANANYPDGKKLYVFPVETNITLVGGAGGVSSELQINVTLPFSCSTNNSQSSDNGQESSDSSTTSSSGGE